MGLFSWFHKKKKNKEKKESIVGETLESLLGESSVETAAAEETGRSEAEANLREAKIEYEAVTSYFTDTQKIDMIPEMEKKQLLEAAEKLLHYKGEREKCKGQEIKLSERHRKSMEQYEDSITAELKNMKENEQYQAMIKNDMRHLEGEKGALLYEREEIVGKQESLKKLAVTTAVLVVALIVLLIVLSAVFEVSMSVPFLLTVIMGVGSAFYMVVESRRNRKSMALTEKKLSKAIGLLNKVKIKYVNNTNCLEYAYEKLGVESSMELEYVWKQYLLLKERERQFRKTTEKINQYNQIIIEELKKYGINDAEVWTYQPEALLDKKEMVEVRHRLNVRRQKLRERMDYNNKIIEGLSVEEI